MSDHFLTIASEKEYLLKEKSSKFYAFAFPVSNISNIEEKLLELKKTHLKARHFCYGYKLGIDDNLFRANDDGEPSGTAGKPILGQIEKLGLTDTLVVVVRYFGGTKLGTSGLIKAYKESAAFVLNECAIIEKIITGTILIECSFELVGVMMNLLSSNAIKIVNTTYDSSVKISIEVRMSELELTIVQLKAKLLNRAENDIDDETEVDGVSFHIE